MANATAPPNPFKADTLTEYVPVPLFRPMVSVPGVAFKAKSGFVLMSPYTLSVLENVAKYTLPLAIVGGLYFAKLPTPSLVLFRVLFHTSLARFDASNAANTPGTTLRIALEFNGIVAQTMAVPG